MKMLPARAALPPVPNDQVKVVLDALPKLPSALRYFDDFLETYHSMRDLEKDDVWWIIDDGAQHRLSFRTFGSHRVLLKHVVAVFLARLDPSTVRTLHGYIRSAVLRFGITLLDSLVGLAPYDLRRLWISHIRPYAPNHETTALRTLLHALCELNIGHWNTSLSDYVSKLPSQTKDIYKAIRTGDCFVPLDQQSMLTCYLDEVAKRVTDTPEAFDTKQLRDTVALIIAYQNACRPGQIARIRMPDVQIFPTGAVHYKVVATKKRDQSQRRQKTQRLKRDWCPIAVEYYRRRRASVPRAHVPRDAFLGLMPSEVGRRINKLISEITDNSWSATDLRHSAAQRMADAGSPRLAIAEFLMQSNDRTASVYIKSSPNQAQKVNEALGISPIYSNVARVARTRTIDMQALLRLPTDQQIGGMPHGIPIAGIGACHVGQSVCIFNPVMSCYNCRHFLPASNLKMHQQVTDGLRPVVKQFAAASRGGQQSPAYLQIRRTLEAVERVIHSIKNGNPESE